MTQGAQSMIDKNFLKKRMQDVEQAMKNLERIASKPYEELSLDEKFSMRYQVIVLAEAVGSICLHIAIEDFGYRAESYGDCLKYLEERKLIRCVEDLTAIMRMRNLLVHRYWLADDSIIYTSVRKNFGCVSEFLRVVGERYGI